MKKALLVLVVAVVPGVMIFGTYTQDQLQGGSWSISGNVTMRVAQWLDIVLRDIDTLNYDDIKPLYVYSYGEIETWNPENSNPSDQSKYGAIELTIDTNAFIKMSITGVTTSPDVNSCIKSVKWRIYRQTPDGTWRPKSDWEEMGTFIIINDRTNGTGYIQHTWTYIQLKFDLDKDLPPSVSGYYITLDIAFQPTVTL